LQFVDICVITKLGAWKKLWVFQRRTPENYVVKIASFQGGNILIPV
jgi:hypothetical protein